MLESFRRARSFHLAIGDLPPPGLVDHATSSTDQLDAGFADQLEDMSDSPEIAFQKKQRARWSLLPYEAYSGNREVIDLVYYHERTINEVSEIVGIPVSTVKTRMYYARKEIGTPLERFGFDRPKLTPSIIVETASHPSATWKRMLVMMSLRDDRQCARQSKHSQCYRKQPLGSRHTTCMTPDSRVALWRKPALIRRMLVGTTLRSEGICGTDFGLCGQKFLGHVDFGQLLKGAALVLDGHLGDPGKFPIYLSGPSFEGELQRFYSDIRRARCNYIHSGFLLPSKRNIAVCYLSSDTIFLNNENPAPMKK